LLASRLDFQRHLVRVGLAQAAFLFHPRRTVRIQRVPLVGTLDVESELRGYLSYPCAYHAGPVAGKTRVLVCALSRLVAEGIPHRAIRALAIANKAASDMLTLVPLVLRAMPASVEVAPFRFVRPSTASAIGGTDRPETSLRLITPMMRCFYFVVGCVADVALGAEDLPKALENLKTTG